MDTTREHRTFTPFRMKGRRLRGPVTAGLVMTIAAAMAAPAAAVALTASPASATVATAHASHRGQLVSATPLRTFKDRAAVTARLKADGFNPATDRYGVRTSAAPTTSAAPPSRPCWTGS
jgi:hypothetical protein